MKKSIIGITGFALSVMLLILLLDLCNITHYIPFSRNYDWISFIGSFLGGVIGGLATFIGVYFTIKSQKQADDEKNRQAIIPVIEYKISYDKTDFDNSKGQLCGEIIPHINVEGATYDGESEEWYFNLIAENIGLGSAQITEIKFNFKENGTDNIVHSETIRFCYKLLKTNASKGFRFLIYAPKTNFYKDGKPTQDFIYPIEIVIHYEDLIGNKYQQKIFACIAKSVWKADGVTYHSNFADLNYYEKFQLNVKNK